MSKAKLSISINKELVDIVKSQDPSFNLSGFCQKCLEIYIDINNQEFDLDKISRNIRQLNLERELIVKNQLNVKYKERDYIEKQNKVWSELYAQFLKTDTFDWECMKTAIEVLGQDEDTLIGMLDALKNSDEAFDKYRTYNDWLYVVSLFGDVEL